MSTLGFTNPIVLKSLALPGTGAMGSETPTLGGTTVILRGKGAQGSAVVHYTWESWSAIQALLALSALGTTFSVELPGYSGQAILPVPKENPITWANAAGADVPQEEVIGTPLDIWDGDVTLILYTTSGSI